MTLDGEVYHWSKHHEFLKFLDLPNKTSQEFELALSSYEAPDREMLECDERGTKRQPENADVGGKPDPEKLQWMSMTFAFRYGFDTARLDFASAV